MEELHSIARGLLVVSKGGQPDAAQRQAALDTLPEGFVAPPVAVVSHDTMARGIVTALNWFLNDSHRAFEPSDVTGVMKHLGQKEDEVRELFAFARELTPR